MTPRHKYIMDFTPTNQLTRQWNLSRDCDTLSHPNNTALLENTPMSHPSMDAWLGRRNHPRDNLGEIYAPEGNHLTVGTAGVEESNRERKKLYDDMTKLENGLRELARNHQNGRDSQMSNERKLADIESKIQNIFIQITKVDQDSVIDRFLMNKLAQLEETFDENLSEEIKSLANNI